MEVIKVSGKTQEFKVEKIERAINLANKSVEPENQVGIPIIIKFISQVIIDIRTVLCYNGPKVFEFQRLLVKLVNSTILSQKKRI